MIFRKFVFVSFLFNFILCTVNLCLNDCFSQIFTLASEWNVYFIEHLKPVSYYWSGQNDTSLYNKSHSDFSFNLHIYHISLQLTKTQFQGFRRVLSNETLEERGGKNIGEYWRNNGEHQLGDVHSTHHWITAQLHRKDNTESRFLHKKLVLWLFRLRLDAT